MIDPSSTNWYEPVDDVAPIIARSPLVPAALNATFVRMLMGPDLYAGSAVNAAIGLNLILGAIVTGLFKVVGSVAFRPLIGLSTLIYGVLAVTFSLALGSPFGLVGAVLGTAVATVLFALPLGLWLLPKAYPIHLWELGTWWLSWALRSLPFLAAAALISHRLADQTGWCLAATAAVGVLFLVTSGPVIADVPWPVTARRILVRCRVIPAAHFQGTP